MKNSYLAANPRIAFSIQPMLRSIRKNVLLAHHSSIIYRSKIQCDADYVGRTSQRLQMKINQHVSASIRVNS